MIADLSYIERKLNCAAALLDEPDKALAQLLLAQTRGVQTVVNETDDPLVEVQHALRLAERMVEEGKHEAVQDNLRLARWRRSVNSGSEASVGSGVSLVKLTLWIKMRQNRRRMPENRKGARR